MLSFNPFTQKLDIRGTSPGGGSGDMIGSNNLSEITIPSEARANIGGTQIGSEFFTAISSDSIVFPMVNADNTVSWLSAEDFRSAIGSSGGGGGAISTPAVVWVMSDGNDTTGDGSLASPFATAQKAYDTVRGYGDDYCIMFGVGSFGAVNCGGYGWRTGLSIRGMGANVSKIGAITSSYLVDLHSDNSVEVASVAISEAYPLTLHSVTLNGSATATGSNGGEGAPGTPGDSETPGGAGGNGSDGQAGPAVKAYDCIIGGELGSHGGAGGAGGAGGSDGGAGAGSDGTPGNPGSEGEVTAVRCRISSISGGSGLLACTAYNSITGTLTDAGGNAPGVAFA